MSKTYWWRFGALLIGALVFGWGYQLVSAENLGLCRQGISCLFKYNVYVDPLMFLSLSLLVITPFLFFVSDAVFLKWLRFAVLWFGVTAIFIIMAPVYTGGFVGFGPTKESVSIWMGSLFVVASLVQIILAHRKLKQRD